MKALARSFDQEEIRRLGEELDRVGFLALKNVIDPAWLARAQAQVKDLMDKEGFGVLHIVNPGDIAGSATQALRDDEGVRALIDGLARYANPRSGTLDSKVFSVLRIVAGGSDDIQVPEFHYDESTITMLTPVMVPEAPRGFRGEIVVFPNRRRFRGSVIFNLLEKALVQSRFYNRRFYKSFERGGMKEVKDVEPGDIYFFWGYRTYHGNFGCRPDGLRASILLHHGNPHGASKLLQKVRDFRTWRVKQHNKNRGAAQ